MTDFKPYLPFNHAYGVEVLKRLDGRLPDDIVDNCIRPHLYDDWRVYFQKIVDTQTPFVRPLRVDILDAAHDIQDAYTDIDKKKIDRKEYKRRIRDASYRIVNAYIKWRDIAKATARVTAPVIKLNGLNDRVHFVKNPNIPMPLKHILYETCEDFIDDYFIHPKQTLWMRLQLESLDAELKDFARQMKEEYPSCFVWAIECGCPECLSIEL